MAGDPGVEYPRETIEGSDFEINSLIRLFIRQLKTDSSQFGQIFSQTNFWSKYSSFFFFSEDVNRLRQASVWAAFTEFEEEKHLHQWLWPVYYQVKISAQFKLWDENLEDQKNWWNGNKNANLKCSEHKDTRRKSLRWNPPKRSFEKRATRLG